MMLGILFGLFFLLLFIGMPVAYGMVISLTPRSPV